MLCDVEQAIEQLYPKVKEFIQSVSGLQRKFPVGHIVMARIVDRLEEEGIVGKQEAYLLRTVLVHDAEVEERGVYLKYDVIEIETGERVGNCFVLRLDRDPAAVVALEAYAGATQNRKLAEDIFTKLSDDAMYPGDLDLYVVNKTEYIVAKSKGDALKFFKGYALDLDKTEETEVDIVPRNRIVYVQRPEMAEDYWWFDLHEKSVLIERTTVYHKFLKDNDTSEPYTICSVAE